MPEASPRFYKVMIMLLPVGVVIGTIVFMFAYFYMEREDDRKHAVIASYGLRMDDLDDMVSKFSDRIGERNHTSEAGRKGLKQAASMIEGRLGPQNVGYNVSKGEGEAIGGLLWKSLWVDLRGSASPEEVVLVAVSYSGEGKDADANCVSSVMMLASSMAREKSAKTLRFVFLPLALTMEQQNQWLVERCLQKGETCVGIVGFQTMKTAPSAGGEEWESQTPTSQDEQWWKYLSQGGVKSDSAGEGAVPSLWLSASVYSFEAWQGRRYDRLNRTIQLAGDAEKWLRRAAE